ncbi:MAG TPA: GMC family oxidoreductase [Candidatus Dormibacteraeota bacterium]|nr:GMC family oxidoreductase [Candidatus Dormibacteraeota bacterium]
MSVLTSFERRQLRAVCDAIIPRGGSIPEGALDAGVPERMEEWLERFSPSARRLVRAMLGGYSLTPLLSSRPRSFAAMDTERREAWASHSDASRFRLRRESFMGLHTLVTIAYASAPEVRERLGWDGSPAIPVDESRLAPPPQLPATQWPDQRDEDVSCDVVIVGSGAGGSLAARELVRAGLSVVIVEEGGVITRDRVRDRLPVERLFDAYRDQGLTATLGSPIISLPMGRAVGGTTVVNSGTCFRTPDWVLEGWSRRGLPGMSPDALGPYFDDVEDLIGVAPVPDEILGPNGEVFRRGATALGLRNEAIRRNARGCHGHGQCAFVCPIDAKQAMHVAVLPAVLAAGARLFANCKVTRVAVSNGRAVGVVAAVHDPVSGGRRGELRVHARAVVLAAGAIFTPALLQRQRLAASSKQVGRNLVIHPAVGTTAQFDEDLRAWRGVMQNHHVDELIHDGILLEATFPPPGLGYSAGSLPGAGLAQKELFAAYPHMAAAGSVISDHGVGRVRAIGGGVLIRYDLAETDARKIVRGIALASRIFFAAGARRVYPMLPGLEAIDSPDDVRRIEEGHWKPSQLKVSAYHPMGTCRMGADAQSSVVDSYGQVHDVPGLWVLDASIMPSSTVVNPQVTVMALAARGARRLADALT